MTALHFQSATDIAHAIKAGEISARGALEHFLDRIDRFNGSINAVVYQDREGARGRADAADAALAAGEAVGPLHGVPMTTKESYQIAGTPTTFGIPPFKDNIAKTDALSVQRMKAGGVNIFGKTNVPMRLADFQSYNDIYGVTNNPWDLGRSPGGSSGGSAAALAAGLTGIEMGSDIAGSIRNPAHFCGVYGHKPTWNLLPPRGHVLDDSVSPTDMSVIGPLARSAFDLETAVRLMAGPDEIDLPGLAMNLPSLDKPMSDLRIGVWISDPLYPTSAGVGERIQAVADALGKAGANVDDRARPDFDPAQAFDVYHQLLIGTMATRLPPNVFRQRQAVAESLPPDERSPSVDAARLETMRLRDWAALNEARAKLRWSWRRFFDRVDFMITPVSPTTAFPHDHSPMDGRTIEVDGERVAYLSQAFWPGLVTAPLLPATAFPAGLAGGLPVGLQIVGPAYSDLQTIQLAQRLERMGFAFQPPPGV